MDGRPRPAHGLRGQPLRARLALIILLPALLGSSDPGGAGLDGLAYDARLCAAELRIIGADLERLQDPATRPVHRLGLDRRIRSALSTLPWLCRRHAARHGLDEHPIDTAARRLRRHYTSGDRMSAVAELAGLIGQIPLELDGLRGDADSTPKSRDTGGRIYHRYCAACHDNPATEVPAPAYSLFRSAAEQTPEEFIARMLGGVRGTHEIGLQNPLSDQDVAGMYVYFLDGGRTLPD